MKGYAENIVGALVAGRPVHASRTDKEEAVRRLHALGRSTNQIMAATGLGKSLVNAVKRRN